MRLNQLLTFLKQPQMKKKLKRVLEFILTLLAVFMAIAFFVIMEKAKFKEVAEKDIEIIQLKKRINELEINERHVLSISGNDLKVTSRLNIAGKSHKHIHEEVLKLGKNEYYYVLSDEPNRMSIYMQITKY